MAKNKKLNSEEFFKLIKQIDSSISAFADKFSLPLVFISSDSLRIRRSLAWMKDSVPALSNIEQVTYFSSDLNSKQAILPILQALGSPSLFSKQQIIVVHNANKIKATIMSELVEAASRPQIFALLVLLADETSASLEKIGTIVEFEEFSKPKITKWIKKEFAELGFKEISNDALAFLVDNFNGNLGELAADISRVSLLAIEDQAIELSLVKNIVLSNAESSGFDLFAAISQGKVTLAQERLAMMYRQGMHPLQVNAFLSRCFRTLAVKSSGSKELSNPWFRSKLKSYSGNYSPKYISRALNRIAELDFALKDSGLPHEDKMANAVLRLSLRS